MNTLVAFYVPIKMLHVTTVILTISLFIIRAYWSVTGSALLQHRLVRTLPHVVDATLLVCGVLMALVIGPFQPWIITKVVLLIAYIGFGTFAIKRGKTPKTRLMTALVSILIFAYIVGVAMRHNPASWFS